MALGGGGGGARALGAHLSADRARRARAEAQQQGDECAAGRSIEKFYSATCRRLLMLRDGKRVLREGGGERGGEDAVSLGG